MPSLSCHNLTASYGARRVLEQVTFYVDHGEGLCILGENGAGKSTLLKCLLGLMRPDSGKIETEGFSLTEVGYLPQQTEVQQDFPATVFEIALSGCLNMRGMKPFYSKKEKHIATDALSTVGAIHLKNKSFRTLSGGQKQRVLLARALCSAKRLLILDEPAAGLDPSAAKELLFLMESLKKRGLSVIMVSHDTESALSVSERVLHLSGRDTDYFFGTSEEYLASSFRKSFGEVAHHD